jgi:hypothetical protein
MKKLTKSHDCSSTDCINRFIKKGTEGSICLNCYEILENFINREREREINYNALPARIIKKHKGSISPPN